MPKDENGQQEQDPRNETTVARYDDEGNYALYVNGFRVGEPGSKEEKQEEEKKYK